MKPHEFEAWKQKFSASTRARNPELFGAGAVHAAVLQPNEGRALDKSAGEKKEGGRRVGGRKGPMLRVSFISLRRRAIDDSDNDRTGLKELRDAIARDFGCDDRDGGPIQWEYGQAVTRGKQETLVRMELI